MNRFLALVAFLFVTASCWADGMVMRATAVPAEVRIPGQRALIRFTNGVERLVIETRFTGEGTNFAWVVPLPSPPVFCFRQWSALLAATSCHQRKRQAHL